jgi:hypothetical protein
VNISFEDDRLFVPARSARVTDDALIVELEDGRKVSTPLVWYPRLLYGTARERTNFEIGEYGIHWPDLDEDLSIKSMLLGNKSGESQSSLERWLESRRKGKKLPVKTLPLPAWAKQKGKVETRKFAKGNI